MRISPGCTTIPSDSAGRHQVTRLSQPVAPRQAPPPTDLGPADDLPHTQIHIFGARPRARVSNAICLQTEAAATRRFHPPHVSVSIKMFVLFFFPPFVQNVKGFSFERFSRMSAGLRRLPRSVPPHAASCSSVLSLRAERGGRGAAREGERNKTITR